MDLPTLARLSAQHFLRHGAAMAVPAEVAAAWPARAGVFVTVHTRHDGALRGCIGTIEPICANTAEETVRNAISATTEDPRFPPVSERELPLLHFEVSVLEPPEPIDSTESLDPRNYGVVVASLSDRRRGLLLPNIEGVDTVADQVSIARRKARIGVGEAVKLFRFKVTAYEEKP